MSDESRSTSVGHTQLYAPNIPAVRTTDELDPSNPEHAEALAIMSTFDARLTAAEKRIDRVLARLGIE